MTNWIKELYYLLLDLITLRKGIKVKINDQTFMLPARYYKYFPNDYEKENFSFCVRHCRSNMTVIDIGAHFGLYSVYMQKLTQGKIYSFEPTPSTSAVLKKTLRLNKIGKEVEVIPAAVAEKPGKAQFFIEDVPGSVSNSLVHYKTIAQAKAYEVDVVSIDAFAAQRQAKIDFIKLDAEGVELSVLKGADRVLTTYRPLLILALHPDAIAERNETLKMIWDFLKEKNYQVLFNGKSMSEDEFSHKKELFDVHLVPAEQWAIETQN